MVERSRTYTVAGVVLRQRSLGEKDRIVVLYSRERGKLSAVAKGARQPRSKLAALSQPLTYGRYTLSRGKSLDVLTQGVAEEIFFPLRQDLLRLTLASCALELLDKSVPEGEAAEEIFNLLLTTLFAMQSGSDPELAIHAFELQLLHQLGYLPALKRCARCDASLTESGETGAGIRFSAHFGGTLCEGCRNKDRGGVVISVAAIRAMVALRSADPASLQRQTMTPSVLREMRRVLHDYIRYRLDIDLKSHRFLDQIQWKGSDFKY